MKKFLKVFSIIMIIVNVLILAVSILALTKPEATGEWIVNFYEDITNDIGHTVGGMYARLSLIASISACISLFLSSALCGVDCYYICKNCGEATEAETVEKETMEEPVARLTKEEKAAKKAAKLAEKKAKKEAKLKVQETLEKVAEVVVEEVAVNAKNEKARKTAEFLKKLQDRM